MNYIKVFAVVFLAACSIAGCKKRSWYVESASRTAMGEYSHCGKIKFLSVAGQVVKLDVCGTVRWYRCFDRTEYKDNYCEELKRKKKSLAGSILRDCETTQVETDVKLERCASKLSECRKSGLTAEKTTAVTCEGEKKVIAARLESSYTWSGVYEGRWDQCRVARDEYKTGLDKCKRIIEGKPGELARWVRLATRDAATLVVTRASLKKCRILYNETKRRR